MKIRSLILFVLAAVVCGAFLCADSQAKVCFLGEDCGSGGNFSNANNIDPDDMCLEAGYILKTECEADSTMHAAGYCPYSSKYVTCCSKEYAYSKCAYPLKSVDVCGNKYKCVCDEDKYPYYQTTISNTPTCVNSKTGAQYSNGYASGGSCSYPKYESGEFVNKIRFSKCSCDRGLYPKTADECGSLGSETSGVSCTDTDGNTYYSACLCGEEFDVVESKCEYGMKVGDPFCLEGNVTRVKDCCTCPDASYPYENTANFKTEHPEVLATTDCRRVSGCTYGDSKLKATKCAKGWEVDSSGKCVPIPCEDAIKLFIAEDTSYALFTTGGKLVDANGNEVTSKKYAIVGDNVTVTTVNSNTSKNVSVQKYNEKKICTAVECRVYSYGDEITNAKCEGSGCECRNANNCYCDGHECWSYVQPGYGHYCCSTTSYYGGQCSYGMSSPTYGTIQCTSYRSEWEPYWTTETQYTYRGLGKAFATDYYSAAYLANNINKNGEGFQAMKRSCTKNPTITIKYTSATNFPVSSDPDATSAPTMYFYGANLKFSKNTTAIRNIRMENAQLIVDSGVTLTTNRPVTLYQNSSTALKPENAYVNVAGTWNLKGKITSTNYEFNPRDVVSSTGKIKFYTDTYTTASKDLGTITLGSGQEFAIRDLYLTRTNGSKACPPGSCTTTKYATLYIKGPTSGTQANVYTNAHLGYDGSSYSRNMQINLSKYVVWNMWDQTYSRSYTIELTPNSKLEATDKSQGGNVSSIRRSDGNLESKCYMISEWTVIGRDTNDCQSWRSKQDKSHGSQNIVCSIDKNENTSVTAGGAYAVWLDGGDNGVGWYSTADQNEISSYIFNAVYECRVGDKNWASKTNKSWAKWDGCRLYQMKNGTSGEKKYTASSPYIRCE